MSINNIPTIRLGDLEFNIIQGGMGVGVSRAGLAAAIAEEGGAGIIASVALGVNNFAALLKENELRFQNAHSKEEKFAIRNEIWAIANKSALKEEISKARRKTNGVIGVNIMHALSDYSSLVEGAVEAGADLIISRAGIPKDLPKYLNGSKTKLVPIVASVRLAEMICKAWDKYGHPPDAIIIEGPMAGGHLGYSYEQLADPEFVAHGLEKIVKEVLEMLKGRNIPIIAAGGIYYGGDIRKFYELGAAGVQMAERFVTTDECDVSLGFKEKHMNCKPEDILIIKSPVGMPGRAIRNQFLDKVERGETVPIACPYHCISRCVPENSPYCIARALVEAKEGKFENGYAFCGSNAWRNKEDGYISVHDLFQKLDAEYASGKVSN